MIRMLGVLCGAAIATALLTWLVGVPQFTSEREAVDAPLAIVALPEPSSPESASADGPALPGRAAVPSALAVSGEADVTELDSSGEASPLPAAGSPADQEPEMGLPEPLSEPQWFAFWTPFRSEIAANGFVSRLQTVTGLDYRVVKVKSGVYEVAFAYSEDDEIESNLATIAAATGLELAGIR